MADRYLRWTRTGPGRLLTRRLGLPRPEPLHRWSAERPVLEGGPLLHLSATPRASSPGEAERGCDETELRAVLGGCGLPVVRERTEGPGRLAAVLLDATGVTTVGELTGVHAALHPLVRSLAPCGRVVLLGARPSADDPHQAAAQQALEGFVRSLGKELGRGRTATLVRLAPRATVTDAGSTLRFLFSPRSAFVSGQVIEVARDYTAAAPQRDATHPALLGNGAPTPAPEGDSPTAAARHGSPTSAEDRTARSAPEDGATTGVPTKDSPTSGPENRATKPATQDRATTGIPKNGSPTSAPEDRATTSAPEDRAAAGGASRRVALVTGAARGIGEQIAERLAREGTHVVCLDVPQAGEDLTRVADRLAGTALPLDITADDAGPRIVEALPEGRLDVLVHNAGITRDRRFANMAADRFAAVLEVNLASVLRTTDHLLASGALRGGRVVATASIAGIAGNAGQTNYAASKAGVLGLVRALAPRAAAEHGTTVNAVAPGFIETRMTAAVPFLVREAGRRMNSLSQGGLPVDVAETVAWLAEPASGGVNGQTVRVCGQSLLGA